MIIDLDPTIVSVAVRAGKIRIVLKDGREISMPLHWFPRIVAATQTKRRNVRIVDDGQALRWPDVDEDFDISASLERESIVVFPPGSLFISDDDSLTGNETNA